MELITCAMYRCTVGLEPTAVHVLSSSASLAWSTPEMEIRFKAYTDIANDPKEEMRKQIDRKQALIAKLQEEIFALRVHEWE